MVASSDRILMPSEAFLTWEEKQEWKHEYLNGEAYAMAGGTLAHNDIAVNLTALLKPYLRDRGCKVRMADAKVQIREKGPFFYPDVVVTCDQVDQRATQVIQSPCLVIEVLSPSTEGYDRGEKFRQYRRLPSLTEYVLINAESWGIEVFRLNQQNHWELVQDLTTDTAENLNQLNLHLSSIDFHCSLADIYDDVIFPESATPTS